MTHFHKNLAYLMRRQGETQTTIAEFVGVTQPAVSHWLRNTMPRQDQLERLAQLFEVTVDDLANHELPHRKDVQALADLQGELTKVKDSWIGIAKRLKQSAEKHGKKGEYIAAAQNDWMGSSIESCACDLAKVLEVFFPAVSDQGGLGGIPFASMCSVQQLVEKATAEKCQQPCQQESTDNA